MTLRQKIVRRWTRMLMPFRYPTCVKVLCWCDQMIGTPIVREPVRVCPQCGTAVLRRVLDEDVSARWYATGDYRRWVMGTAEVSLGQLLKELRRAEAALEWLHKVGYDIGMSTVLDVGCGAGGALIACRLAGAESVVGVDVDARSDAVTGRFNIPVFRTIPPHSHWERIWCSHLIEHILDPVGFLRALREHLKNVDWSYVYIETPEWGPKAEVKLPHPFTFSQDAIHLLAKRAGLIVAAIEPGLRAVLRRAG